MIGFTQLIIAHGMPDGPMGILWLLAGILFILASSPIFWTLLAILLVGYLAKRSINKSKAAQEDE